MKNPIQALYESGVVETTDFPADSRYSGVPTRQLTAPDGREVAYLARRFVPAPEAFATQSYRVVSEGERLDQIAAETIGNPEAFWLHCDANRVIWAEELEAPGVSLRLTFPEGVPGPDEEA